MQRFIRFHSNYVPAPSVVWKELNRIEEISEILREGSGPSGYHTAYYECLAPDRINEVIATMNQWGTASECTGEEIAKHQSGLP